MPSRDPAARNAYGPEHRTLRARLLADLPTPCGRCGVTIPAGIDPRWVHLDHITRPVSSGGIAGEGVLSHRRCDAQAGAAITNERRRARRDNERKSRNTPPLFGQEAQGTPRPELDPPQAAGPRSGAIGRDPAASGGIGPDPDPTARVLSPEAEAAVLEQPWIKALGAPPANARLPRVMTGAHPAAVGSYGTLLVAFCRDRYGIRLRWWQAFMVGRLLEHDVEGDLVWHDALVSTARQVGKSVGLRCLAMFRLEHPEVFGEDTVMTLATSLKLAAQVQRASRMWADSKRGEGWRTWAGNTLTAIETPEGRQWIVSAAASSHGHTVGLMGVDEAWGIRASVIEDHAEPTLLEARQPQLLLTSTAHQDATSLWLDRRAAAVEQIEDPDGTLILEWSAPSGLLEADLGDVEVWRLASPEWSRQRENLMRDRYARAVKKGDLVSFRTQYLNVWPRAGEAEREGLLVDPEVYAAAQGVGPVGLVSPVYVVEDDFEGGAVVALAERAGDGIVRVTGEVFEQRSDAWVYVENALDYPGTLNPTLLVGASLQTDPELEVVTVTPQLRGGVETRHALSLYRALLGERRVIHDVDAPALTGMFLAAHTTKSATGVTLSHRHGRVDLVRAAIWAVAEAAQPTSDPAVA